MSEVLISGAVRQTGSKGVARRLRQNGQTPGVVYGKGDPLHISLPAKELMKFLSDRAKSRGLFTTRFEGDAGERQVIVKDLTWHPVTDQLLHIDLWEVDPGRQIDVKLRLEFTGVSRGVKEQGGTLAVARNALMVRCLPGDIIPTFTIDITNIMAGEVRAIKDLGLPETLTPLDDPNLTVVAVSAPKAKKGEGAEGEEEAPAA